MKAEEFLEELANNLDQRVFRTVNKVYCEASVVQEFAETKYKELIEDNKRLKGDLSVFKPVADEYMNDFMECAICGNHPSTIIRTNKGTFCEKHVKY